MSDHEPAPTELVDGDVWSGVLATGDYVGQHAERLELGDVIVSGGRWSGVALDGLRAFDVVFEDADLAGLQLQESSSLQNVVFRRCRLSGAVFAGGRLRNVRFEACKLDDANLRMVDAERVVFDDCVLVGADLHAANLVSTRFAGSDLRATDWTKSFLRDVDLRGSRLEDVRGADSLRGVTIAPDQVVPLAYSLAVALDLKIVDDDAADDD